MAALLATTTHPPLPNPSGKAFDAFSKVFTHDDQFLLMQVLPI
jgi:hypothetical protein